MEENECPQENEDVTYEIDWSKKQVIQTYYSLWDKSIMRFNINS